MESLNIKDRAKRNNSFDKILIVIIAIMCGILLFRLFMTSVYIKVYVVGSSMEDTLHGARSANQKGGDYVYAIKNATPKRGDIVIIQTEEKVLIKRVIGLAGDRIEMIDGVLYRNGNLVAEPYVSEDNYYNKDDFVVLYVQYGYMFCMGDNRDDSLDSRNKYGQMPVAWTIGVVADWSLPAKGVLTNYYTFVDYTLPNLFGSK